MHPIRIACLAGILGVAPSAFAQHHGHGAAKPSPYAAETGREIKALSADEQRAWLEGQGQGLARAAELNGFPGPMHTLELGEQLRLTPEQQTATRELMDRHKAEVRALGAELVAAERQLDASFRRQHATEAEVERLTLEIGRLQARIRTSHLHTHLAQRRLLSQEQVAQYARLRGYQP
jgi:Spy/CpxP family protein refolding chaperone